MVVKDEGIQEASVFSLVGGRQDGEQDASQESITSFGQVNFLTTVLSQNNCKICYFDNPPTLTTHHTKK